MPSRTAAVNAAPSVLPCWVLGAGAVVRLHSALIAVLTHLVGKLKGMALRNLQVGGGVEGCLGTISWQ